MTSNPSTVIGILLVALVALVGAVAVWRTRARARQVELILYREASQLRRQACAVAVEIARRHNAGEPLDSDFFALWPLSDPLIYSAAGPAQLAELRAETFSRLGYFHAQLASARSRIRTAALKSRFEPTPYRVLSNLVRAYYEIDPWIRSFQKRFGDAVEPEPDIRLANDVLTTFETAGMEPIVAAYCWADCAYPPQS